MSCERCGGLMVVEAFGDRMEEQFRTGIEPTRCLNCGNYEDAIVRANRTSSQFQNSFHERARKARGPRVAQSAWRRGPVPTENAIADCLLDPAPSAHTQPLETAHIDEGHAVLQTKGRCT